MSWLEKHTLQDGEEHSFETPVGRLEVLWRDGQLHYLRRDLDGGEAMRRTMIPRLVNSKSTRSKLPCALLPIYPDRPVVFTVDGHLAVPPGCKAFFCFRMPIQFGLHLGVRRILMEPLAIDTPKNTWWGENHRGVLCYGVVSAPYLKIPELLDALGPGEALVPVVYENGRSESDRVERCLVSTRELDLYTDTQGRLIFEVLRLIETDQQQEPRSRPRLPRELASGAEKLLDAPNRKLTLFERVKGISLTGGGNGR